jgi:predicted membrane protein
LPALTVAFSIYTAVLVHANLFSVLGVTIYGAIIQAYVVTGLIAGLGSKAFHDRFGHLIAKEPRILDIRAKKETGV